MTHFFSTGLSATEVSKSVIRTGTEKNFVLVYVYLYVYEARLNILQNKSMSEIMQFYISYSANESDFVVEFHK